MSGVLNPPAFPVRIESPLGCIDIQKGMDLRDYFAGQALVETASLITVSKPETFLTVASLAYQLADAMLKARATPPAEPRKGEE